MISSIGEEWLLLTFGSQLRALYHPLATRLTLGHPSLLCGVAPERSFSGTYFLPGNYPYRSIDKSLSVCNEQGYVHWLSRAVLHLSQMLILGLAGGPLRGMNTHRFH